jgi:hypothetical protein
VSAEREDLLTERVERGVLGVHVVILHGTGAQLGIDDASTNLVSSGTSPLLPVDGFGLSSQKE